MEQLIVIRGGGDLATGIVQKFHRSGFRVLVLEAPAPTAIRRSVAVCEAVYEGEATVEDLRCRKVATIDEMRQCHSAGGVPLMIDPAGELITKLRPAAVIDAILAKRNTGTHMAMAPVTVGLGPGFYAGQDVHAVIETIRGHDLGRMILSGGALPNTGIPGEIGGKGAQRVIHSPASGKVRHIRALGDIVGEGEAIFEVSGILARAPFKGLLRGLIREGAQVEKGMKTADIDPRLDVNWRTISDKARCLGGAALEAYFYLTRRIRA